MLRPGILPTGGGGGGGASSAGAVRLGSNSQARGSTNTNIHRFNTVVQNDGGVFTVTDSATNGTSIQVSTTGWYQVSAYVGASSAFVAIKTDTSLNNNFSTSDTDYAVPADAGSVGGNPSGLVYLSANDLLWVVSSGTLPGTPARDFFAVYGPLPTA